jgi:hypothetical protein
MREHNDYSLNRLYNTSEKEISEIIDIKDILKIESYCKEAEEAIKAIRQKLFEQTQRLQEIKIEKYILIRRRADWYNKRIEITVFVETKKILADYESTDMIYNTHQKFNGNQKKQALQYAEELKKQYNLKIVKENWK